MNFSTLNSVMYRYFREWCPNLPPEIMNAEGEQFNFFLDLANSFRFDDYDRRRLSGFKMQPFNLSATHFLGDWTAVLTLAMAPYLPQGKTQYELNTDFSFVVQWIPISEIKSDMSYNKRDNKWLVK
jgi:hypothetical protein